LRPASEGDFVFNVVWTGSVFTYLRSFVASQMHYCGARYRFVGNGCPPDQIELMEQFRARQPDRVVEVLEVSDTMVGHGAALDLVRAQRDDGPFFCTIDPDILARGPFLAPFADALTRCAAITSGRGVWRDDDVVPRGHPGVSGEYFYSQDGCLFGSPHFAIYHRAPLDATTTRWNIGLGEAGKGLSDAARARLERAGHDYFIYDTGKLVNIFLQVDGNRLLHREAPNLMHIGGLSHYLAPANMIAREGEQPEPDWARWRGMASRFEVARFTAAVLRALCELRPPPAIPNGLDAAMTAKLQTVRTALVETIPRFEAESRAGDLARTTGDTDQ
jgi:hypothetical protein